MNDDDAIDKATPYTKTSKERLRAMARSLRRIDAAGVEGDVVECGIWHGGNIILTRMLSPDRVCWLYDTFAGMFNPSIFDFTRKGYQMPVGKAAVSVEEVRHNLEETGTLDMDKLRFIVGPVEATLSDPENLPAKIALLRLDTDWYESTRAEMRALWPLVQPNGTLIVDDYWHWRGCYKAFNEYFGNRCPPHVRIDKSAIMITKPADGRNF